MQVIPREAQEFGLGKTSYYALLVGSTLMYQLFSLGMNGAIIYGSALLGGVIMTVLIPVTEVLAVLFFHEPFTGIKGIAVALSVWGFVSYFYGEIRTHAEQSKKSSNIEELDGPGDSTVHAV
jgi:drug/metabolite transporter (DMT)-like permease